MFIYMDNKTVVMQSMVLLFVMKAKVSAQPRESSSGLDIATIFSLLDKQLLNIRHHQ